jgi:PAS domain S-box-containing protein
MALSSWPDRRFIDVNDAFLRTLGYSRDEVVGKMSRDLEIFAKVEQREAIGRLLAERGMVRDYEVEARTRDGATRNGLFSAELLKLQEGSFF